MQHLLLDLDKAPAKKIPFKHARIGLFVSFKAARRMSAPDEPHGIYVLPRKKAARSIAQAAAEILQHHPDARIAIASPRKKLAPYLQSLQRQYPHAVLLHKKRLGKSIRQFLKHGFRQPETPISGSEQRVIERIAQEVRHAAEQLAPPAPTPADTNVFTLLPEPKSDAALSTALSLLKKNRPKKKQDLVRLLSEHTNREDAQRIIGELQNTGRIRIDAAENVKYR